MPYDGSNPVGTAGNWPNNSDEERLGWQIPWEESFLLAFDKKTGQVRWKAMRGQSRIGHVTPNIMRHEGQDILVSGAGDVVQGFDLKNGKRLWSVYSQGEGVVPSIVIGGGLIYTVSGFEKPTIRAVKPPTSGTGASIVWEQKKGVPMIPSLIFHEGHIYGVTEGGVAICLKADSGEIVWQERVGGNHYSSPVLAENRIYFLNEEGECIVIDASPTFKILARSSLNEKTQASMAISRNQVFIRTAKNLYCIASKHL